MKINNKTGMKKNQKDIRTTTVWQRKIGEKQKGGHSEERLRKKNQDRNQKTLISEN